MDQSQITITILLVSLSVLWLVAGIINYFIVRNYTNNKKVICLFICLGFLGSLILSFYGFTKLIDTQEIKADLKKEFSRSNSLVSQEYDWVEENEQINEKGEKVVTKSFYYHDKLVKVETVYEIQNDKP